MQLQRLRPGHILRFASDPAGFIPPGATLPIHNDNRLILQWPIPRPLGLVQVASDRTGRTAELAEEVARHHGSRLTRLKTLACWPSAEQSGVEDLISPEICDFVGYVDGRTYYVPSSCTVFSKDFSGCLMAAYWMGGARRVAHIPASVNPAMDCKRGFFDHLREQGGSLIGWFRPYEVAKDEKHAISTFQRFFRQLGGASSGMTTFGVITARNEALSILAIQSKGFGGDWVVVRARQHALRLDQPFC